jgi:hypothetical protein
MPRRFVNHDAFAISAEAAERRFVGFVDALRSLAARPWVAREGATHGNHPRRPPMAETRPRCLQERALLALDPSDAGHHQRTLDLMWRVLGLDPERDPECPLSERSSRDDSIPNHQGDLDPANGYIMEDGIWFCERDGRLWAQFWAEDGLDTPHEAPIPDLPTLGRELRAHPPYLWHPSGRGTGDHLGRLGDCAACRAPDEDPPICDDDTESLAYQG